MEDFSFDVNGILSAEEAEKLFEEQEAGNEEQPEQETEPNQADENPSEKEESQESVGENEDNDSDMPSSDGDGSSPNVYSSIAKALKDDGIFSNLEDVDESKITTPEEFAEFFDKAVTARLDEKMRRIDEALGNGVQADDIKKYEQTISYLDSIKEESVRDEGEAGEELRRQLIFNDLINRGYSEEKARKELEKSFRAGSDVEDAADALEALKAYYNDGYKKLRDDAKKQADAIRDNQKKQAEQFKKLVLEDEVSLGDTKLDKKTCQRVFDAVSKPVYKDPETGRLLTAVQKFQKEQPLEFLKQLGIWYVMTDGGKSIDNLAKKKITTEMNKGVKELARKLNNTAFTSDGSMQYVGSSMPENGKDILLSDDWKIG